MKAKSILLAVIFLIFLFSCNSDNGSTESPINNTISLKLSLNSMPELFNGDRYYLWAEKNGSFSRIGALPIILNEAFPYPFVWEMDKDWVEEDINILITVESASENITSPSDWIVATGSGNLSTNSISLSLENGLLGSNNPIFENSEVVFFLNAPSAGTIGGDQNGIWFIDAIPPTNGGFTNLPDLGANWEYSVWLTLDDSDGFSCCSQVPIGKFSDASQADTSIYGPSFNNEFKGPNSSYPFVGEDFIADPNERFPDFLFPIDLRTCTVSISISPKSYAVTSTPFPFVAFTKTLNADQPLSAMIVMDNNYLTDNFSGNLTVTDQ